MLFLLLCVFAALADPGRPDDLRETWRSVRELRIHDDLYRRVDTPIRLRDGPVLVTLRSGYLFPVFSGRFSGEWASAGERLLRKLRKLDKDAKLPAATERGTKRLVGFVWVAGEGEVTAGLQDRADALRLANTMVRRVGEPRQDWEQVAVERRFTTGIHEGLFLGPDSRLRKRFLAQGGGTDDPYEVIVYEDDDPAAAARRASTLFDRRLGVLGDAGLAVADDIAWSRTADARGLQTDGDLLVLDLHADRRFGRVNMQKRGSPEADEWLTHLRYDDGRFGRWRSKLLTVGRTSAGTVRQARLSGALFPASDPAEVRQPPRRLEQRFADATVLVDQHDRMNLDVTVQVDLTFAVHGDLQWTDLRVPRVEAVPGSFEMVRAVDPDGVDLMTSDREVLRIGSVRRSDDEGPEDDDDGVVGGDREVPDGDRDRSWRERAAPDPTQMTGAILRLYLPEAKHTGDELKVRLEWKDTWPLGHPSVCSQGAASTGLQDFLPSWSNALPGNGWRFHVRVGLPVDSKLTSAASGVTVRESDEGGWHFVHSSHTTTEALFPGVAVGRWQTRYEPAAKGLPAVRTHLLRAYPGQLSSFGPEARRVISYFERWVPRYPVREIEIFEAPSSCYGYVWIAPHGLVNVQRMVTMGEVGARREKHLEHAVFSHELAHQYWGHLAAPASIEDFWIAETFAEGMACMYVGDAFDPRECAAKLEGARAYWERDVQVWGGVASLTEAYTTFERGQVVYGYGPYVFHNMLRRRLGNRAYFAALDVLMRDHPHGRLTTERLKAYFEAASQRDLSDFFDFWVYQGLVPRMKGRWRHGSDGVRGTISSDVPFGTFDVPVLVRDKKRSTAVWVEVVNGEGSFVVPGPWRKPTVELDPGHAVLARQRGMRQDRD